MATIEAAVEPSNDQSAISDEEWYRSVYRPAERQYTFRAVFFGCIIGSVLSAANLYTGFTIGWTYGASITAAISAWLVFTEGRKRMDQARAACAEYDKLSEEVRAEEEKIAKPSEVSVDILNQLKAQRVMVAVELAGLNARVKACDAMLNEPKRLEVSTLQSVSDMKVKAEIERIGTKEKLDQINAFIADGDRREAIQATINRLNARRMTVQRQAVNLAADAEPYALLVSHVAPRPLEGNKIVISPVEWTE